MGSLAELVGVPPHPSLSAKPFRHGKQFTRVGVTDGVRSSETKRLATTMHFATGMILVLHLPHLPHLFPLLALHLRPAVQLFNG